MIEVENTPNVLVSHCLKDGWPNSRFRFVLPLGFSSLPDGALAEIVSNEKGMKVAILGASGSVGRKLH